MLASGGLLGSYTSTSKQQAQPNDPDESVPPMDDFWGKQPLYSNK